LARVRGGAPLNANVGPLDPLSALAMKNLLILVTCLLLCSCGSVNFYQGDDAALVPRPCGTQTLTDATGKQYRAYISIVEIDGSFTGSGRGCPYEFTYQVKPGSKRITLIPNLDSDSDDHLLYGRVELVADLKPKTTYLLIAAYTGTTIGVRVVQSLSGLEVGYGETSKIDRSSKGNAALKVIPLMVK